MIEPPSIEGIAATEKAIVDGVKLWITATSFVRSAVLEGSYPDTELVLVVARNDKTKTLRYSVWDGTMTGSPAGIGSGPEEYIQLLDAMVLEWSTAPYWGGTGPRKWPGSTPRLPPHA